MGYLIAQILIYLLLAALIGFVLAWVLRGARLGRRIEELENELFDLRREASTVKPAAASPTAAPAKPAASTPAATARTAASAPAARPPGSPTRGTASSAAPAAPEPAGAGAPAAAKLPAGENGDDLKRIKGIGPKIEAILHDLGIHYFTQIAGFTPENVAWVNERLRFKGRIEREEWIRQARELSS